jgi:hypothetical protein
MRFFLVSLILLTAFTSQAQRKYAFVRGTVQDDQGKPVGQVSVVILGRNTGIVTNDSGFFRMRVPAEKTIALVFSHLGFAEQQKNFYLSENEEEAVQVMLQPGGKRLEEVVVSDRRERNEVGLSKINPKNALILPSTVGGVEGLIKILVGSNNELSSQYSVRGGNYDENLIYINDFEIFRPYLVRSGQQEGLSFINPEMARNVSFYNGGFQAKYGDKMSSVLDIQYKKAKQFGGSAYVSLLEQGFHLEGSAKKEKVTYLVGVRNRSNNNLLSAQETRGAYIPSSNDIQTYITYKPHEKWQLELLTNLSQTRFTLIPESAQKTSSVFSPLFTANLGLDIFFEGQERDRYNTHLIGLTAIHSPNKALKLKWMLSHFRNVERENFDISGSYLFGDRDFDNTSTTFGQIVNPLGAGFYQNYARNLLEIDMWNASMKGSLEKGKHFLQWGNTVELTRINDRLYEWEYQDSAGYSIPVNTNQLFRFTNSTADLDITRFSGYVQDNITLMSGKRNITLQAGLRYNYNTLNKEFLISPRAQLSFQPNWKRDVAFKVAAGLYQQPPFYRELRRYDGSVNTALQAQKSFQVVAGMDYNFTVSGKPFRISTEAYYKHMTDVIPYDIDNVRIRYFGENNARAYAYGLETRIFGELVKDAESWFSFGFMRTRENINNDIFYKYLNASGEVINAQSTDQVPVDSIGTEVGWVRRPTDRLITMGLFLQDYLATNKNFKVHLNLLYGSNMPYNIPNSVRYRNALIIDPYIRVDIGFSALLLGDKAQRRAYNPFRKINEAWLSLEVFNLIDRPNTISYQLIKDFSNAVYSIPNRLTPRLLNLKLVARF